MACNKRSSPVKGGTESPTESKKKRRLLGGSGNTGNGTSLREKLQTERQNLPIYRGRRKLIQELNKTSTAIVIGETACGKTTQIPQYIYEGGLHNECTIACTQPRRVAAITIAKRVSEEMGVELGDLVGYCIRFDDTSSHHTKIRYMTDGMLLREAIGDPLLKRYSFVILDEAHERTIHTDVLFGVVKKAQKERLKKNSTLKVIVMSATMDVDHFSQYFNKAPVFYLQGRQHAIELHYASTPQMDYLYSALVCVLQLHSDLPIGHDILVFLTGQEEIETLVRLIKEHSRNLTSNITIQALPLYAALSPGLQLKAFQSTPLGSRKVIVSTNIAETSVTIKGIKVVIDTGMVKAKTFNPGSGLDMLRVMRVSRAQAWQRMGRAGREGPGSCFRLYTEKQFNTFAEYTVPEIQRCNLASVLLQLLALKVPDVTNFDFMDKPSPESISHAVEQLNLLGAVEKKETLELTDLGQQMVAFPLDPSLSKVILVAKDHNCLEEVLSIVSLLSTDSVFHNPSNKKDEAEAARQKFISDDGDHVTLLNIMRAYNGVKGNKNWCFENYLQHRHLSAACDIRRQLREICDRLHLPVKSCGQNMSVIRKCLTSGFFMNSAELRPEGDYCTIVSRRVVSIHPSSSLFQCKPACVMYNEIVETSKCYMRNVSVVDPEWLYEASPLYFKRTKSEVR